MVDKSLDTGSHLKNCFPGHTPQSRFFASESSLFLREVRFSEQKFSAKKSISDIKYHYSSSQNNNPFYLFNDQLDYALANYFTESETSKDNIDRL